MADTRTDDPYDAVPYDRLAVQETHPDQLAVLARLYGLGAAPPEACRVLELGCAAGGNLIPMAWHLPGSRFLGLDLAGRQVEEGRGLIRALGLENVAIDQVDVAACDLGTARFDYVIAHGLYSWVPAATRAALLALIARHLAPQGVAYLSFNALPGWRMRGQLRDMLLYHCRDQADPAARLAAARGLLRLLRTGLQGLDALTARYLRHEVAELEGAPDSYLYHEYLAPVNEPELFGTFVARAGEAGLGYLCNAELHYQFPAALGEGAEAALADVADPLERQQYLDFLLGRNFHQALLVHAGRPVPDEPDFEALAALAWASPLAPPRKLDLRKAKAQPFIDPRGAEHPVSHPLTKAALALLAEVYPAAISYPGLEVEARRLVSRAGDPRLADQPEHLFGELFHLFAHRAVLATTLAEPRRPAAGEAPVGPRATALARLEAGLGRLVGPRHDSLLLGPDLARLVQALDGTRDPARLAAAPEVKALGPRADLPTLLDRLGRLGALEWRPGGTDS